MVFGLTLNLTEQMQFYGAYHANGVNQLVHVIFVPLIWGSMCCGLACEKVKN